MSDISVSSKKLLTTQHQWVRGDLSSGLTCLGCDADVDNSNGQRCSFCFQIAHVNDHCLRNRHCTPLHGQLFLKQNDSQFDQATPLAVFINVRSGGGEGALFVPRFKRLLHENQIFLLDAANSPERGLKQFNAIQNARLLCCGGDGTVNWLLQFMQDKALPIAILPLGTGNDLARTLGWNAFASVSAPGLTPELETALIDPELSRLLLHVASASVINVDRWRVDVDVGDAFPRGERSVMMTNYLSFGVDAQVAMKFHQLRESQPALFVSSTVNKLFYANFGMTTMFDGIENINQKCRLTCDGRVLTLPDALGGIIVLNINSYAGGCDLWSTDELTASAASVRNTDDDDESETTDTHTQHFTSPSVSDGILEIVGSFHMGAISVNASNAIRVAQARVIEIEMLCDLPFQIDGEPHLRTPCKLRITHARQIPLLLCPQEHERDLDEPVLL